jgi:hypothetical protein
MTKYIVDGEKFEIRTPILESGKIEEIDFKLSDMITILQCPETIKLMNWDRGANYGETPFVTGDEIINTNHYIPNYYSPEELIKMQLISHNSYGYKEFWKKLHNRMKGLSETEIKERVLKYQDFYNNEEVILINAK